MFILGGAGSIKIFGDMTLIMIPDHDPRRFRLLGGALPNWGKGVTHYLPHERALTLLDGIEERTKALHAKSLEHELKRIAEVKALLRNQTGHAESFGDVLQRKLQGDDGPTQNVF